MAEQINIEDFIREILAIPAPINLNGSGQVFNVAGEPYDSIAVFNDLHQTALGLSQIYNRSDKVQLKAFCDSLDGLLILAAETGVINQGYADQLSFKLSQLTEQLL